MTYHEAEPELEKLRQIFAQMYPSIEEKIDSFPRRGQQAVEARAIFAKAAYELGFRISHIALFLGLTSWTTDHLVKHRPLTGVRIEHVLDSGSIAFYVAQGFEAARGFAGMEGRK